MTQKNEIGDEMSDAQQPAGPPSYQQPPYGQPVGSYVPATIGYGPVGTVRSTGVCFLLSIVTFGIYGWYWYYSVHEEMKRHTGQGLGGGIALVLAIFVGFLMPFMSSGEVGGLYQRRGLREPVTAVTGLWALLLGWFFLVGYIVWFVKTNEALNAYWRSLGAV